MHSQIKWGRKDNFDGLMLPEGSRPPFNSAGLDRYLSPLMETNVMVLPPSLVRKENAQLSTAGFVEVLDFLTIAAGFHLCGMKMVHLSLVTAGALQAICSESNSAHVTEVSTTDLSYV